MNRLGRSLLAVDYRAVLDESADEGTNSTSSDDDYSFDNSTVDSNNTLA